MMPGKRTKKNLQVIDRLEVGPVRPERRRLVAPYKVFQRGGSDETQLIYRFEEDVFSPDDPGSQNLANMMAAQVAINYGLFCKEIRFRGIYDDADRRFIRDMAENTAREIFVKKFLEENPFLTQDLDLTPPGTEGSFLKAEIVFADGTPRVPKSEWDLWSTDPSSHAVLSSGGKDSLLTFGVLNEIGCDVHSIFINESGRHWFTALNGYRYLKARYPNTARVWVNSDRVFSWMLRRMPFIRKDFSDVRSDEYPIRLWTVAVFLFGAIPLMRKRGIARLLIGDEYDTTARMSYQGIRHYNGLYDQSRYFDNALSRYFLRKGWSICQFSILRSLSELLIEKTLALRYPELQAQQVSCHATHKEGERVHPCGKCEKCRRVVGMLVAVGADPTRCGYTTSQVERCLRDLGSRGIHQEAPGARHLDAVLLEKRLVELSPLRRRRAREYPEILRLRFDEQRSPVEGIPADLRRPVYSILLEHAEGALLRTGRKWEEFDMLKDSRMSRPYPFELRGRDLRKGKDTGAGRRVSAAGYLWGELTWPEAEKRLLEVDVALLPVGSIEQHGPHLPLDTDAFDAEYLARKVAEVCSHPKPLVLPLVPYGVSYHHEDYKGTISISNDTLSHMVYEIGIAVARNGVKKLLIINGHGGNSPALNDAAQRINQQTRIFVGVDTGETSDVDVEALATTTNDVHAGEIETSTALAVRPHLVRMEHARREIPRFSSRYLEFSSKRGVSWHAHTSKLSSDGVMGDPTKATAEKGERMWQVMIAHLVALVEDLKSLTLDEIFERKY
jgi:creatinine amidohydrolase/Fe(II)-dependent formamide hydrolase-like protein